MARGIRPEHLTVNRTLIPDWIDDRTGDVAFRDKEKFEAVRQGYACGDCLYWFGGLYFARCPRCDAPTGGVQITPQFWTSRSAI